ncbi:hypothetical protein C825_001214 [Parabacteroides sp. ASF519]|nr:hypothetical protein C825_001214 [Parabacteroides sp. ASF519]
MFLIQFVNSLLVLFQMLAQHGIHIAAYRDFTSGDVVHDSENFAVDIAADIDTLAGLYLVAAQEQLVVVLVLPFPAATFSLRFFPCGGLRRGVSGAAVSSSVGAAAGTSCAGRSVPSCVRRPMEANSSSSSMPSVFTFLLPMLTAV